MKTIYSYIRISSIQMLLILTLISSFLNSKFASLLLGAVMILNMILVLNEVKLLNKIIILIMILFSIFVFIKTKKSLYDFVGSFSENAGILSLFIAVPLLGMPLKLSNYATELEKLFDKLFKNKSMFIIYTSIISYLMSLLLNLASIPIMFQLVDNRRKYFTDKVITNAIMRGYLAAVFWSPNFISVSLILNYLNLSWLAIVPLGILVSIISIMISTAINLSEKEPLYILEENIDTKQINDTVNQENVEWKYILELLVITLILIIIMIILNITTNWHITIIVTLLALIYPLLWSFWIKDARSYLSMFKGYMLKDILKIKNEIVIFGAVGVFASAMGKISLPHEYNLIFSNIEKIPLLIVSLIIFYAMWITSTIGIHPLVMLATILASIRPEALGIQPSIYVLILLGAYGMALIGAPFSGTALLAAGIIEREPWEVSVKWNIRFLLMFPLFISIVLTFIQIILFY